MAFRRISNGFSACINVEVCNNLKQISKLRYIKNYLTMVTTTQWKIQPFRHKSHMQKPHNQVLELFAYEQMDHYNHYTRQSSKFRQDSWLAMELSVNRLQFHKIRWQTYWKTQSRQKQDAHYDKYTYSSKTVLTDIFHRMLSIPVILYLGNS